MDDENPYRAPTAAVADNKVPAPEVPDAIAKKIRTAYLAAALCGGVTLIVTLMAIGGMSVLGFSAWQLLDVALMFGLAYGIYRRSRACAVIMLAYFIISKVMLAMQGNVGGLPMGLLFSYFFWQGVAGTYAYHRLVRPAV